MHCTIIGGSPTPGPSGSMNWNWPSGFGIAVSSFEAEGLMLNISWHDRGKIAATFASGICCWVVTSDTDDGSSFLLLTDSAT